MKEKKCKNFIRQKTALITIAVITSKTGKGQKSERKIKAKEQTRKYDSVPAHKENFLADLMNNVRAKDQRTTPILPIKQMNPKPDALIDFKSEEKSQCESDSESTTFNSDSESEETEISEDDQPDDLE